MKLFRSRFGAGIVCACSIAFSILFGSFRSLNSLRAKAETLFYGGNTASLHGDLSRKAEASSNLLKVAGKYLSHESAPIKALDGANRAFSASDTVSEFAEANIRLGEAAKQMKAALSEVFVSEADAAYVRGFFTEIASRDAMMKRDPYNQRAEEFNRSVLGRFPANVLGKIVGVREMPLFIPQP